ncbi:MAG: NTP/NDP exchange transporter [Candidatus Amoebophilus sp.]
MSSKLTRFFKSLITIEPQERAKVFFLAISFFLIIGAYTISKELKDAVFTNIVGLDYQPIAKTIAMIILVPAIFFYSRLVDLLRRHQLLYFYTIAYGILGLIFAYYLGHPTIGLVNTESSPYRIFGWLFYFFIEGFSPFVVGVFWAFVNSVSNPAAVTKTYPLIIAGSKLGGMFTSILALMFLAASNSISYDVFNHQVLLGVASVLLLIVPLIIDKLVKIAPKGSLHGYEASYQEAKQRLKVDKTKESVTTSVISGLVLLLKHPYVLGIFAVQFFYEIINQVFNFERLIFGQQNAATISQMSAFLIKQAFIVHFIGLVFVLVGTRPIITALGEKKSLMLVPTIAGLAILYYVFNPSELSAIAAFVVIRAVNYAFATPLKESLYIPTIKEVQFKSKSWIDGFGAKFAKTSASTFNYAARGLEGMARLSAQSTFFSVTVGLWILVAYLLGRKFEYTVKNNEVIGAPKKAA